MLDHLAGLLPPMTDAEIVGDARQPGDDFLDTNNNYTWYYAVGDALRPRSILEFGVRYGYSAIAILRGSGIGALYAVSYTGIDAEADGILSNDIALRAIKNYASPAEILRINTADAVGILEAIGTRSPFDLVHVDADHSENGIRTELQYALLAARPAGVILIDDIDAPHVRAEADRFCRKLGITPEFLPTFHGTYLVDLASVKFRNQFGVQ